MSDVDAVPRGLRTAAGYGWRILILIAIAFLVLTLLAKLTFVVVAVFVGLVITAICGPLVRVFDRFVPRGVAVALSLLLSLLVIIGIFAFISVSVAGQWADLNQQFGDGVGEIQTWLKDGPLNLSTADLNQWIESAKTWFNEHRGDIASGAVGGAGAFAAGLAGLVLAVFCAVCFLAGGSGMWGFVMELFPVSVRDRVHGAGDAAWNSFAGYTRGIFFVAASNGLIVCILLLVLRVPLAVPLALLVFIGTFVPLIGAPIAMSVAVIVALASQGPFIALIVLVGIVLIGQVEGNILQPLIMSKAVDLHPLVVALAVTCGAILGGLVGAIVAVPAVSVLYAVLNFWFRPDYGSQEPRDLAESVT